MSTFVEMFFASDLKVKSSKDTGQGQVTGDKSKLKKKERKKKTESKK